MLAEAWHGNSPIAGRGVSSTLAETVAACGQLAGASTAMVVRVESTSPPVVIASAGPSRVIDIGSPRMRGAMEHEAGLMFPTPEPSWIDGANCGSAMVIASTAGAGAVPHLLVLSFTTASAVARAKINRLLPALIALVVAQLEAAATIAALEEQNAIRALALGHDACGVIAVRDDHSIVFANAPAMTMLADNDGLHVKRGVLRPVDHRQAVRFEAALDTVQQPAAEAIGRRQALVMLLPSQQHARPLIVALVPVSGAAIGRRGTAALLYLFQGVASAQGLDTIAELHGLTGVERRLLAQLCAGLTLAESAAQLRIKLETARAYLKQIFAKTDTHRQTELVALMTRYLGAVRGDFDFRPA